jgi:type II secretory pathway component GspD/PulD (secretin)
MTRRSLLRLLISALLAPAVSRAAENQVLEVIPLGYRQAEDVIPMLRPLLAPGGTLTGMKNQLVVRTTPANMAELKQVLASVDAAPRRLMISVRQTSGMDASRDAQSVQGAVGVGDNGRVTIPGRRNSANEPSVSVQTGRTRIEGNVVSSQSARNDQVTQTLQVLEGNAAFIRTGQSTVMPDAQVIDPATGRRLMQSGQVVEANTGFYVTPRVSGDRVTLEIATSRQRLRNPATGTVSGEQVGTVVSGRLGEWMEIGGMTQTTEREQGEILGRSRDARRNDRRVMLKVDEVQ